MVLPRASRAHHADPECGLGRRESASRFGRLARFHRTFSFFQRRGKPLVSFWYQREYPPFLQGKPKAKPTSVEVLNTPMSQKGLFAGPQSLHCPRLLESVQFRLNLTVLLGNLFIVKLYFGRVSAASSCADCSNLSTSCSFQGADGGGSGWRLVSYGFVSN